MYKGVKTQSMWQKLTGIMFWDMVASDSSKVLCLFIQTSENEYQNLPTSVRDAFLWLSVTFGSHYLHLRWKFLCTKSIWGKIGARDIYMNFWQYSLPSLNLNINPMGFLIWPMLASNISHISYSWESLLTLWYNLSREAVHS